MRLICIQLLVKNQQVMQVDNDKSNFFSDAERLIKPEKKL